MGDGGVACVPSQRIMEQFLICGGKTMNNHNGNSSANTSKFPRMKKKTKTKKVKKEKEAVESSSKSENLDSRSIISNGIGNREVECNGDDANKEEVEEGELGTMDVENGVLLPEKPQSHVRKFELKSEIERGEFVRPGWKWREKNELHSRSWRGSFREEVEKGEFVQDRDRWRRSDMGGKDDYGYSRMRRHDSGKEKGWKGEHEWTAASSFKYASDKEFSRNRSQHVKRPSRYEGNVQQRTPRISSTVVDEESSFKNDLSNGKNHVREYSSGNLLKRHGGDSDFSDRKHRGDYDDYKSFKSRKLSDDSSRPAYSFEKYSRTSAERSFKKVPSSARNVSSDKYSSRHRESPVSGRHVYDKRNSSPHHYERSPRDRAHYHEHRDWSPARRDKSPYDRVRRYDHSVSPCSRSQRHDHSRSPYDRSSQYGHRNRSPSYSEWSPHDQSRYHERRDRTPNLVEQSPRGRVRPQETGRKSGSGDKRQSHCERKGEEEKPDPKDIIGGDQQSLVTDSKERSNPNSDDVDRNISLQTDKDKLPGNPDSNAEESNPGMENGVTEELVSMEEDMDICNTPPHVPEIADAPTGKWFYLDLFGVEQGPSRLCDLRRLMEEGVLVSDHFIKHIDSDRWVTIENAVSPLVSANFQSVVSDTVTQRVSPPEAPGNLLAEYGDAAKSLNEIADEMLVTSSESRINSMEISRAPEASEDLHIDERVEAFLEGVKIIPGRELETVGEVLQISFEHGDWERWGIIEGEQHDLGTDERLLSSSELASTEAADFTSSQLAPSDKDNSLGCVDAVEWFSGLWSCKGGDWKRNDEVAQDRSCRKRLVLNDGYPLCQMLKPGNEDPRWQRNDEIYNHSQPRKLDLLPWAFTSPDDWNERVSQSKPAFARGVKGQSLPVIRINACVVKDQGSFVSEPRMKGRGKERYSKVSRAYSSSCDAKRLSEEGVPRSRHMHEQDSQGLWKSTTSLLVPKDHVCTTEELQLQLGDWFYLDGSGHEHGPLSFAELQILADQGIIQKHSSVFRKVDRTWVPISTSTEDPQSTGNMKRVNNLAASDASLALVSGSVRAFHDLHPQFIGYTRGKLHELVMKSYKSREFAAAINEFLDPWINARQPRKEMGKHIYNSAFFQKSDQWRASKRPRIDGSEEDEVGDMSANLKSDCSFEELCGDAIFHKEDNTKSEIGECWGQLDGHVLARVFHFLRADLRSLDNAALTCKSWRSVVKLYKTISTQIDLCSVAESCNDSMIWSVMNGYNKEKIKSLIVRGCTNITSGMLEEVLRSFPHLSLVDIRGCSQFEDLACKFPNVIWIRSHGSHSKIKSLKHITDATSSSLKMYDGVSSHMDESTGLRNYLESSDKRESSNQLFRRSLYKRSKLFDARKTSSILSRDAHLRRLAMRKYENGYRRMAEFLSSGLKDIMKQNNFDFFVPKVAEIEDKMKSGYYASRGLSAMKEDISRMCRDAIRRKNRGNARDMNRIITLFIQLAASMDGGPKTYRERDEVMNCAKEDSPPGFSSASSKHKKALNKVTEKKYMNRSNGSLVNGISDYGEYASDREIRRRLSKLNRKTYTGSETSDDDRSTDESTTGTGSTASDTDSDLDSLAESRTGETKGEAYFTPDDEIDSLADDREWGARMTKASLVPPVTRKYEVIDQYVIVADEEEVKRKMQVSLPEDYADKVIMQKNGTEESDMEIPEVKDYKPRKQLGNEVIEQEVYGIDPYTHNLLLDSMPEDSDWSLLDKHMFIEDVLLCTLNKQVRHFTDTRNVPMTYSLKPVFEEILKTANEDNDRKTMRLCQYILKAIDSRPEDKYVAYRKGLGVVCNKEGGFGEEDFVVEFLGEVYPSWKWFEKQDGIRALQKNSKDPAPEFYNIYLERPKGDAEGYDLVVVDAMHKANYASRICHSCRPNCEAKVTAVDGQYQIGIYTVRPIRYGEEVTFDYNSVTESKEEYEASVCLCGSQVCRGSYLNLTGEGAFQKVLKQYHGILDRLHLMLEACELNSVSDEDYIDLSKAGLGSCLLGGLPDWLIAYAARLVRFINFERTKLPDEILKHNVEEKKKYYADICLEVEKCDAEVQAEGVYNQRLQNLALTLDKVRYVMRCIFGDPKMAPPPLERLCPEEVVSFIWKGEGSLVEDLIQYITPHVDDAILSDLKADIRAHDPSGSDDDVQMELQKSLKWLRDEIRNLQCTYKCRHDAAADLIHIYAHTKCFFKLREYGSVTSPPVYISPLDLCPKYADKVGSNGHEYCKSYGENYCLGQLIYWYNQTNADPDSCLARASRGCLSLPDIGSFYAKVQKPSRQRVYGPRTVKFMLARMEKQPQRPWPKDRIWSFKSLPKIFGSPMLDAVLGKAPLDKEMVHWLKHRPSIFQAVWDR